MPYTDWAGFWKNTVAENSFSYRWRKRFCNQRDIDAGRNLGILVFTNTDQNLFYEALKWEILDAYLGNPYRNYSKIYLSYTQIQNAAAEKKDKALRDSVALKPIASLPLTAYTGNYLMMYTET